MDVGEITVTYQDGQSFTCPLVPSVLDAFERRATKAQIELGIRERFTIMDLVQNPGAKEIFFLGYEAAKWLHKKGEHPGSIKATYESWLNEQLASVDLEGDEVPLDETPV